MKNTELDKGHQKVDARRVSDATLDKFVDQTYQWKTLLPHQVFSMAVELQAYRKRMPR